MEAVIPSKQDKIRVLVADDQPHILEAVELLLSPHNIAVDCVRSPQLLLEALGQSDYDVLLISDYSKGVCTPNLLRAAIDAAREAGVPVLVDPLRDGAFDCYRGATVIKPNRREAEQATGARIAAPADAIEIGARLCRDLELEAAVITLKNEAQNKLGNNVIDFELAKKRIETMPAALGEMVKVCSPSR